MESSRCLTACSLVLLEHHNLNLNCHSKFIDSGGNCFLLFLLLLKAAFDWPDQCQFTMAIKTAQLGVFIVKGSKVPVE
mgnify:CR=1 FL=1